GLTHNICVQRVRISLLKSIHIHHLEQTLNVNVNLRPSLTETVIACFTDNPTRHVGFTSVNPALCR
ncbi:hypothetical protein L9F63_000119, partial [Diploptera punctata]